MCFQVSSQSPLQANPSTVQAGSRTRSLGAGITVCVSLYLPCFDCADELKPFLCRSSGSVTSPSLTNTTCNINENEFDVLASSCDKLSDLKCRTPEMLSLRSATWPISKVPGGNIRKWTGITRNIQCLESRRETQAKDRPLIIPKSPPSTSESHIYNPQIHGQGAHRGQSFNTVIRIRISYTAI